MSTVLRPIACKCRSGRERASESPLLAPALPIRSSGNDMSLCIILPSQLASVALVQTELRPECRLL